MKRRQFIQNTGAAGLATIFFTPSLSSVNEKTNSFTLEENFLNPPQQAFPRAYWFWMNGHVSREGITLDLEAMKEAGIGGVFQFDGGTGIPKGPVEYLSEEWLDLKKHAMLEADRLGLEFVMHNCPGWSASGGPWITPELAMQQITWNESFISGGKEIRQTLPLPLSRMNHYRDIAVLAFPSLEGEELLQAAHFTGSGPQAEFNTEAAAASSEMMVQPGTNGHALLTIDFKKPFLARQVTFYIAAPADTSASDKIPEFGVRTSVLLEFSEDGETFTEVTRINTGLDTELAAGYKFITYDITATKARYFRFSSEAARVYKQVQFSGITRLKNWMEKTNHRGRYFMLAEEDSAIEKINDQPAPSGSLIDMDSILDLTSFMNPEGLLHWQAPPGNWTIVRIGFTPAGTMNRAAPDKGLGLECDKFSKDAFDFHFQKMTEKLLPLMKSMGAKGRMGMEIDSYEAGGQNWTRGFEKLFFEKNGYDLKKFLPALAGGRIIGSVEITERFLWDLRRLQADLMAENYYGRFQHLCRQQGITSYAEPYETGPMEEMQIAAKVDTCLGEFWHGISTVLPAKQPVRRTAKMIASASHVNGQRIAAAEAFTAEPESSRWREYPFALKAAGDKAFTKGINRLVIHRFAHQPHPTAKPGMTMGPWGIHFDRTNTWWNQSKAWMLYLSRCQYLLQQGRFVADLLYFTGEDANMYTRADRWQLNPTPPPGYDYDLVNAEMILKKMRIENSRIILENGQSYRLLILQDFAALSTELLEKLFQLVSEGLLLVGARPQRSTGLAQYKDGDAVFNKLVDQLWGKIDGETITENILGNGRVYWRRSLASVLESLSIKPDFICSSPTGISHVLFIHRKIEDGDLYFICNQRRTWEDLVCRFRVDKKIPECWDADSGKIFDAPVFQFMEDGVQMPIRLEPYGSLFILFRKTTSTWPLHSVKRDNRLVLGTNFYPPAVPRVFKEIKNQFTIAFWAKPEMNILLNPTLVLGTVRKPWTEYYAIFPPGGKELYGPGHACCGITVGCNGLGIWENENGTPVWVLSAPAAISGWSHIAVVYRDGIPSVFINSRLVKKGEKSQFIIHPADGVTYPAEENSWYNGDMLEPAIHPGPLREEELSILAKQGPPVPTSPSIVEPWTVKRPGLLFTENGNYELAGDGIQQRFRIKDLANPLVLEKDWQVSFPAGSGAPENIQLQQLYSLHRHPDFNVKHFSGTATYTRTFLFEKKLNEEEKWFLDLGRVEVIAEVKVNGRAYGIFWKRPYRIEITDALKRGKNRVEIRVTNQWPNRLIGDEYFPDPHSYTPGGASGMESLTSGGIHSLPPWFLEGKPKPAGPRVTFTTWKHFTKESPLLESGLIGPVRLEAGVVRYFS